MRNTLVINPFGIGDVLFSTPLVSCLKTRDPKSYIGYICNIRTKEILETNPEIDEIFVFERDEYRALWKKSKVKCVKQLLNFWKKIKSRKFDKVIDLSLGREYAFLCWLIGIKERCGFNYRGRGRFLTHKVVFKGFDDKPIAEYYLSLIDSRLEDNRKTVLAVTNEDIKSIENFLKESKIKDEDILIGLVPGGGISFGKDDQDKRRWPAEKFSKLADAIIKKFNAKVILIWGPEEKSLVDKIVAFMKEKALVAPKTSIREMAALYRKCKIVLCSEGGPLHIASSQGIETVSIFGPVDEKVYGPYPPSEKHTVIKSNIDCRPCYKHFKLPKCNTRKCLKDISVEEVFNNVSRKIEGDKKQ